MSEPLDFSHTSRKFIAPQVIVFDSGSCTYKSLDFIPVYFQKSISKQVCARLRSKTAFAGRPSYTYKLYPFSDVPLGTTKVGIFKCPNAIVN